MAANRSLTAAFDTLLADGQRRLDNLGGPRSLPSRPPEAPEVAAAPETSEISAEMVQELDARFGDGWSFAVTARRLEADEAVVDGRLDTGPGGQSATGVGRAPLGALTGRADGIPFRIRDDAKALAWAEEKALADCAARL